MCWLQCAGKVICYVLSRLWQNSIFYYNSIAISFYNSCCALFLSFSLSLSLSPPPPPVQSFLSLYLDLSLASQVEREARVDDGIAVSR